MPRRSLGRDFNLVAAGQGLSWLGNTFQPIALAVGMVLNDRPLGELGVLMAALTIARIAATLVGGVWADRLAPKVLMIGSDLTRAVATSVLGLLFLSTRPPLTVLLMIMVVLGFSGAFFEPAMQSLKPTLVTVGQRQQANATLSVLQGIAQVAGPALAGVVVAVAGAPTGFFINAASFIASAIAVFFVRRVVPRPQERESFVHELRDGWRTVRKLDWLLWGIIAAGVYHVANGMVMVLVQVIALRDLGGASALGTISAAEGAGGLLGALIAIKVKPSRPLLAGFLALGLMPIWVAAYVWPGTLLPILIAGFIAYAGLLFYAVLWETTIQDSVPHALLARVTSWDILVSFVGLPIGNTLVGPLSAWLGVKPLLSMCAVVLGLAGLAPLVLRSSRSIRRPHLPNGGTPAMMAE